MKAFKEGVVLADGAVLTEAEVKIDPVGAPCRFCSKVGETVQVDEWDKRIIHHLIVTINDKGHVHVHGPLENKLTMGIMLDAAKKEMEKK